MQRRTAIRNIAIITAGAAFLPACNNADSTPGIKLKNISVTGKEQNMLAELAETILPKTKEFIGSADLKSHEFLLTMMDDCSSPEDQEKFTAGLKAFEENCNNKFKTSFAKCPAAQRVELLKELEANKDKNNLAAVFYKTTKRYTLQSFTSSKEYLLKIKKFTLAPGPFYKGCVKAA